MRPSLGSSSRHPAALKPGSMATFAKNLTSHQDPARKNPEPPPPPPAIAQRVLSTCGKGEEGPMRGEYLAMLAVMGEKQHTQIRTYAHAHTHTLTDTHLPRPEAEFTPQGLRTRQRNTVQQFCHRISMVYQSFRPPLSAPCVWQAIC